MGGCHEACGIARWCEKEVYRVIGVGLQWFEDVMLRGESIKFTCTGNYGAHSAVGYDFCAKLLARGPDALATAKVCVKANVCLDSVLSEAIVTSEFV